MSIYNRTLFYGLLLALTFFNTGTVAYDATSRWGQASVLINNDFFVYGGKTDPFNAFSYTSAPNIDELLYLSLSSPFDASTPPWQLVSSSENPANATDTQGPAVAWHTLCAYNTSAALLFGGQPDPNSPTVLVDRADSANLLDVFNRMQPNWIPEPETWASQPTRRIHHTCVTSTSGLVFLIGGEKADGSKLGFPDNYVFDPINISFTLLPSDNGPPALTGHASVILRDGRILVFGGSSTSQGALVSFANIWSLDTSQSTLTWSLLDVSNTTLPSPRRAFAVAATSDGKILIHGGSDQDLLTSLNDGWMLDTSQTPMTWSQIDALSQLGPRRDHFAFPSGNQVVFGFGYGNDRPAPAPLQIYDLPSNSFVPGFTPLSPTAAAPTLPVPTQTSTSTQGDNGVSTTRNGVHPTATLEPGNPSNGGNGQPEPNDDRVGSKTAPIAIGTSLGVVFLLVLGFSAAYFIKKRRRGREDEKRLLMSPEDGEDHDSQRLGVIPVAGPLEYQNSRRAWPRSVLDSLRLTGSAGAAFLSRNTPVAQRRRDMLADEDTRDFGDWWERRRRDGTASSSWSLRSILTGRGRSHEPSLRGLREKTDPFADNMSSARDEESSLVGAGNRPKGHRETSHTSTWSYSDPFSDPIEEHEIPENYTVNLVDNRRQDTTDNPILPLHSQPLPTLRTILPLSMGGHALSPLSERTSQNTLSQEYYSTSVSQDRSTEENPFDHLSSSPVTSRTSLEPVSPLGSSMLGTSTQPLQPVRRSDSWWARFSRTSFLDRRSSDVSRRSSGKFEIRDPNPPPRLGAIEESTHSASPDHISPVSRQSESPGQGQPVTRKASKVYGVHGKSMSSLRTADSEAIERLAGTMDVFQRVRTGSHRTTQSTSTTDGMSVDIRATEVGEIEELAMMASPTEMTPQDAAKLSFAPFSSGLETANKASTMPDPIVPSAAPETSKPPKPVSGSVVAARIQAFERRMSQDQDLPTTNTRQREERPKRKTHGVSIDYGLVPRASLFVANPDHRATNSADS